MIYARILIFAVMVITLIVVIAGIIGLAKGKSKDAAHKNNKLMIWRVALQATVIVLALLFAYLKR